MDRVLRRRRTSLCAALIWATGASLLSAQPRDGFTILGDYILAPDATLILISGTARIGGDVDIAINDWSRFEMGDATLQLSGLPFDGPQRCETFAQDIGGCNIDPGDRTLFWLGTFRIGPTATTVILVDNHDNSPGAGREAIYCTHLWLEPGVTLDVAGHHVYYRTSEPANPYNPNDNISVIDSVGGGGVVQMGTGSSVTITQQPTSQTVCEGASVSLTVAIQGAAQGYQWRKDGVSIPGATSSSLVMNPASLGDSGNYDVSISASCGAAISDTATVLVWPASSGDVNGDGAVNALDIPFFIEAMLLSPSGPPSLAFCSADMDASGTVNQTDPALFVNALLGL